MAVASELAISATGLVKNFGGRRVVDGVDIAYPDTCVGTDSHTTMVNGLGVLGWGVGGIEAEAAMLGQPVSMLIPESSASRWRACCRKASPQPTWS